jgi:hypothetical protein
MKDIDIFTLPFQYNNRCGLFGSQGSSATDLSDSVIIQNRDIVKQIEK